MGIPLTLSDVPDTTPYIQYLATAGQTVFPYPFPITQDSDLVVVVNAVTLATDSGYTLSGQGNDTGGNVTFTSGQTLNSIVTLFRNIPIERLTQIAQNSGFSSTAFNAEFNNIYLILQQLEDQIGFGLQLPNTNSPTPVTTLTPLSYANKILTFDAFGNPQPGVLLSAVLTQPIFNTFLQSILYPVSAAETAALVVPTNLYHPYGSMLRYGADPLGVLPSDAALTNALACNADVFDDAQGGGTYLFNTGVQVKNFPVTIRGQCKWVSGATGVTGTKFILASAAGANSATLSVKAGSPVYGLNVKGIGFTFQSATVGQQAAIAAADDLRFACIEKCAFIGIAGAASSTLFGISLNTSDIFTGDVVIRDNFFNVMFVGVLLQGSCTTVKVTGNEFYGHAGLNALQTFGALTPGSGYTPGTYAAVPLTGGSGVSAFADITVGASGGVSTVRLVSGGTGYVAGTDSVSASTVNIGPGTLFSIAVATVGLQYGVGVEAIYPVTEPLIAHNYFEGLCLGIYSRGAAYVKQIGNDYGPNSTAWEWVKTSFARIWNQSIGETFAGAGVPVAGSNYPQDNSSFCTVLSGPTQAYFDGTIVTAGQGFQELLRGYQVGFPQNPAFSAGNFSGAGSLVWTVASQTTYTYSIVGKTLTVWFTISGTLSGVANAGIQIAIPGGFTCSKTVVNPVWTSNNGTIAIGFAQALGAAGTVITVFNNAAAGNWATTGSGAVDGMIQIPVN